MLHARLCTAAKVAALAIASAAAMPVAAAPVALIDIDPNLTSLKVTNAASSMASIVELVFNFGGAAVGRATFDKAPGSMASNFWVANQQMVYWQTSTWSGLSVAPDNSNQFTGIVAKLIASIIPEVVTDGPDQVGTSLSAASVTVRWSDGAVGKADLLEQSWKDPQRLSLQGAGGGVVSEPSVAALVAVGLLAAGLSRRRGRGTRR
jgi:hypothetical protein